MSTNEVDHQNIHELNNIVETFKKNFPTETFLAKSDTVEFIFKLADLLKLYPEKDYEKILPKISECILKDVKDITNIEEIKLNKDTINKVKQCLKK
jgi:hypothetical protein